MLTRQKTILGLLSAAGRPLQRTEITKWCFLLRHESSSHGGSAFYDFVPYRFGPFSFCLYHEIGKLEAQHYVIADGEHAWRLSKAKPPATDAAVARDINSLVKRIRNMPLDSLIDYVYQSYPAYTVNSELRQLATRVCAKPAVYTAGYEGESVDSFLFKLVAAGIEQIVDVRNNPIARRYGFHKSTLARLAQRLKIEYVHVPELGITSELRQNLEFGENREQLFTRYQATTLKAETSAIRRVAALVAHKPSVLVCMEADPVRCHRSHLAEKVAHICSLSVIHI